LRHFPHFRLYRVGVAILLVILPTIVYYIVIDTLDLLPVPGLFFFELKNDVQGSLYFVALAFAAIALAWRGFAYTWLAAFLIHLPRTVKFTLSPESLIHNLGFWFLPLFAGAVITLERRWRATQRRIDLERQQERELYIQKVLAAQEEERRRIAKEIHDETLQDLVALAYVADSMAQECPECEARLKDRAVSIKENSLRMAHELRRISSDLRPSTLDHLGLVPSLRSLAAKTADEAGIPTRLSVSGEPVSLDKHAETAIFRIVQEALTNVRKHSEATEAWVVMEFTRVSLKIEIGDNGCGLAPKLRMDRLASEGHLGLLGIRERVASLGGSVRVHSRRDHGTVLRLKIPIAAAETQAALSSSAGLQSRPAIPRRDLPVRDQGGLI